MLAAGTACRFAVAVTKIAGDAPATSTAGNTTCQLGVDIRSRDGTTSPFDEAL